ncbi:MAG: hypothetical protein QGG40_10765, partial [Myxococcota bacterium]|nr:hypothetical protein [Myxococcota bacterium]
MNSLLLGLLACGEPQILPRSEPAGVELQASVEQTRVAAGEPIVVTIGASAAQGWSLATPDPTAEGLDVHLETHEEPVLDGSRWTQRWQFDLEGPPGSYIITTATVEAVGPDGQTLQLQPAPLFVDLGVEGPRGGELSGFIGVPEPSSTALPWFVALCAVLLAGGIIWWNRRRAAPEDIPTEPPHIVALRAWREARQGGL